MSVILPILPFFITFVVLAYREARDEQRSNAMRRHPSNGVKR